MLTPFIFNHQQCQTDTLKCHQEPTVAKSERNALFPSSVSAAAAANQNSRRESHDDSPMMGVVIQR